MSNVFYAIVGYFNQMSLIEAFLAGPIVALMGLLYIASFKALLGRNCAFTQQFYANYDAARALPANQRANRTLGVVSLMAVFAVIGYWVLVALLAFHLTSMMGLRQIVEFRREALMGMLDAYLARQRAQQHNNFMGQ